MKNYISKIKILFFFNIIGYIIICPKRGITIQDLIRAYRENIKLEKELINQLTFRLAIDNEQFTTVEKGWGHKLILKDDLDELWIFKENENAEKIVGIYHLYKLFGMFPPYTFKIILPINGLMVKGTVQKFIRDANTLENHFLNALSQNELQQLLCIHVLDWLTSNCDTVAGNFLISFDDRDQKKILRIDYDSALVMLGQDKLTEDYYPPWLLGPQETLYYWIWKDLKKNKIKLNFNETWQFVNFIAEFPDDFFCEILDDAILIASREAQFLKTQFKEFYGNLFETPTEFKKAIIMRKHKLPEDFRVFYSNLLQKNGRIFSLSETKNRLSIIEKIYKQIKEDNKNLKNKIKNLSKINKRKQEDIKIISSHRAWKIIYWFQAIHRLKFVQENKDIFENLDFLSIQQRFKIYLKKNFCSPEIFEYLIKSLKEIYRKTHNKNEKKAIIMYMSNFYRIKKGALELDSIRRIIIPVAD